MRSCAACMSTMTRPWAVLGQHVDAVRSARCARPSGQSSGAAVGPRLRWRVGDGASCRRRMRVRWGLASQPQRRFQLARAVPAARAALDAANGMRRLRPTPCIAGGRRRSQTGLRALSPARRRAARPAPTSTACRTAWCTSRAVAEAHLDLGRVHVHVDPRRVRSR